MTPQRLYTISELAEITGRHADLFRDAIESGRLRARRPGGPQGRFIIAEQDFSEWLEESMFLPGVESAPPRRRAATAVTAEELELPV